MTDHEDINPFQSPLSTEAPPLQRAEKLPGVLADRSARLLASFADGFLEIASLLLLLSTLGLSSLYWTEYATWLEAFVFGTAAIFIHYFFNGYLLATRGQTVGKLLMGIRIEDRNTSELISMQRMVLLRDLPILVPVSLLPVALSSIDPNNVIGGIVYLIDGVFIFTATRRCLHDRVANTKVVRIWL